MMNILLDKLPEAVEIDGVRYRIRTDWRVWARFELVMLDGAISPEAKAAELLAACYIDLPPSLDKAFAAMLDFYAGADGKKAGRDEGKGRPVYSFDYDAQAITAAFWAQYGIDITTTDMHWWKFKALFGALGEDTQLVKTMQYRSVDLSKIKDKEQRAHYRKLKRLYALPDNRSEEEKEADMLRLLDGMF